MQNLQNQPAFNAIKRKITMRNLRNRPAHAAIMRKLENPNLDEGFQQGLLMAIKTLEKTPLFVNTLEIARQIKYISGDFMGPFIVNANNGNSTDNISSNNQAIKIKAPSKLDLFQQCLDLGLVTVDQYKACENSRITKQMLQNMLHAQITLECAVFVLFNTQRFCKTLLI